MKEEYLRGGIDRVPRAKAQTEMSRLKTYRVTLNNGRFFNLKATDIRVKAAADNIAQMNDTTVKRITER